MTDGHGPPRHEGLLLLFWQAWRRLFADEAIPLAGNIAFRTVFSAFPFAIFLSTLAGFFGNETLAENVVSWLLSVAPAEIVRPIAPEIHSLFTVQRTGLSSLSALLTIWSALSGVDSVRVGLNRAYDLKETRTIFRLYVMETVFVIGTAVVLLGVSFLLILAPLLVSFINGHVPGLTGVAEVFDQLRFPAAFILLFVALTAAHRFLPARRPTLREVWPGVLITLGVWVALAVIYARWLQNFSTFASTYAGLSGIFAAMFFIYLAALALIFGGEINRVLVLHRDQRLSDRVP